MSACGWQLPQGRCRLHRAGQACPQHVPTRPRTPPGARHPLEKLRAPRQTALGPLGSAAVGSFLRGCRPECSPRISLRAWGRISQCYQSRMVGDPLQGVWHLEHETEMLAEARPCPSVLLLHPGRSCLFSHEPGRARPAAKSPRSHDGICTLDLLMWMKTLIRPTVPPFPGLWVLRE